MCTITEDIEEFNRPCSEFSNLQETNSSKICQKCENSAIVVLQKKNPYCKPCFLEYCNHKFKATIGKAKKLKPQHRVLLLYSGDAKSSAMLDMVLQALNSSKRFMFHVGILFIDESIIIARSSEEIDNILHSVSQKLQESNYPLLYSSLEMVFRNPSHFQNFYSLYNTQRIKSKDYESTLLENLNNIKTLTSKLDYIECLKMQLLLDVAKTENYTHIFMDDSATSLAIKFLTQVAVGRGSQVAHNTAFYDTQYEIPICRPMREFLNKEIAFYNHLREINYLTHQTLITKADSYSCIQGLTETFVNGLQENFPSTVFTIFRTGDKISSNCDENPVCTLCKSAMDNIEPSACSALEALSISKNISAADNKHKLEDEEFKKLKSVLCHGCQIILNDMEHSFLPPFAVMEPTRQVSQSELKTEIQEFLLD